MVGPVNGDYLLGLPLEDAYILEDYLVWTKEDLLRTLRARKKTINGLIREKYELNEYIDLLKEEVQAYTDIAQADSNLVILKEEKAEVWKRAAKKQKRKVFWGKVTRKVLLPIGMGAAAYYSSPPRNDRKNATIFTGIGVGLSFIIK